MVEPDEILIKQILAGDNDSFRKLLQKYQALVYSICYNIVRDHQEAENLAQETFIQVHKALSQYEYKGFKTWVSRIAVNKSIDLKRKKLTQKESKVIFLDDIEQCGLGHADDVLEQIEAAEESRKVLELCSQLPDKYGSVLIKHYIESKSCKQISDEEGISPRTVESRLFRAKKMFRKYWKEGEHNAAF